MSVDIEQIEDVDTEKLDSNEEGKVVVKTDILSVELNYEKFSTIFFPPYSANSDIDFYSVRDSRTVIGEMNDGGYIEIRPGKDMRILTHKTYEVYLACFRIWEDSDYPDDLIEVSLSKIAKYMGRKRPNKKELADILYELKVMSRTTVTIHQMFRTKRQDSKKARDWGIFSEFVWDARKKFDEPGSSFEGHSVGFKLSKNIITNVLDRVTMPINIASTKSLRSGLAKMYYSRLDTILYRNNSHQNTATTIIRDFGLNAKTNKFPSTRKVMLESLANQLHGVETSQPGVFIQAEVFEILDKIKSKIIDYKIVFTKTGTPKKKRDGVQYHKDINDLDAQLVLQDMMKSLFSMDEPTSTMVRFSRIYPHTVIQSACSEYKEMKRSGVTIDKPQAMFTVCVHQKAHVSGFEWIKACGEHCKHRPENRLIN